MIDQYPTSFEEDPQPALDLVIGSWYPGFCASSFAERMEDTDSEYAESIISDLTGFMLYYQNCQPADWNADRIEHCLLVDYPRSLFRDDEYVNAVPGVLMFFFEYLQKSDLQPKAGEIVTLLEMIYDDFLEEMEDVDNYSVRKSLFISADNDGVDIRDTDAVMSYFRKIGEEQMEDSEADLFETLCFIQSSWVLPFTDSRYISRITLDHGDPVAEIVCTFLPILIGDAGFSPENWDAPAVVKGFETYMDYPMEKWKRELSVPVLHAFFTYLADGNLQPHAREIADAILPLQDRVPTKPASDMPEGLEVFLLNACIESGVNLSDERALEEFLDTNQERLFLDFIRLSDPETLTGMMELMLGKKKSESPPSSVRKPVDISSIPKAGRQSYTDISTLTDQFCDEHLDAEYREICRYVTAKMARKKGNPLNTGKDQIWAAGIVYAVGQVNFLFDRSFEPYQSADDICNFFQTKKSTTSQKAKMIRDAVNMNDYWDPEYSTADMLKRSPYNNLRMTKDGFIF